MSQNARSTYCPQYYVSPIHSYIEDLSITSFGEKTILLFSLKKRTWRSLLAKKTKEKKKRKKIQLRTILSMLLLEWKKKKKSIQNHVIYATLVLEKSKTKLNQTLGPIRWRFRFLRNFLGDQRIGMKHYNN